MKIVLTIDIDESQYDHGSSYASLVADLLRQHAGDIERTAGDVRSLITRRDAHVVYSTRLDWPDAMTAQQYLASPMARFKGLPGSEKPQKVDLG